MQINEITYTKEKKVGLPNYSSVTVGVKMTVRWEDDEPIEADMIWEEINTQIDTQISRETEAKASKDWPERKVENPHPASSKTGEIKKSQQTGFFTPGS